MLNHSMRQDFNVEGGMTEVTNEEPNPGTDGHSGSLAEIWLRNEVPGLSYLDAIKI